MGTNNLSSLFLVFPSLFFFFVKMVSEAQKKSRPNSQKGRFLSLMMGFVALYVDKHHQRNHQIYPSHENVQKLRGQ